VAKKCSSRSRKRSLIFSSINLSMELFVNYSELKDRDSVGKMASDSMKVM
jgi:hypothetical protein